MTGDPFLGCRKFNNSDCINDRDCSNEEACVNNSCENLCINMNVCGKGTVCKTITVNGRKTVKCICEAGKRGDPYIECLPIKDKLEECNSDSQCDMNLTCTFGSCENPCNVKNVCGENSLCKVMNHRPLCYCPSGTTGNPSIRCVTYECLENNECNENSVCLKNRCVNGCTIHHDCPNNSTCTTRNHEPKCICKDSSFGDINSGCSVVGCRSNTDCLSSESCLNEKCTNLCSENSPCTSEQTCTSINHEILCECPPGYKRNQENQCVVLQGPQCVSDSGCQNGYACLNSKCVDLCTFNPCGPNAECKLVAHKSSSQSVLATSVCECKAGYTGDPIKGCTMIITITQGCKSDKFCPSNEVCINGQCVDACQQNQCGTKALCRTITHRPVCYCPDGFGGNPLYSCIADGCQNKNDCSMNEKCVGGKCINTCKPNNPCGIGAECIPHGTNYTCHCRKNFIGNPKVECKVAGCFTSSECPSFMECLNNKCVDPCQQFECAFNAECRVKNHIPYCKCKHGFDGDSEKSCKQISEECKADNDCPDLLACINNACDDPCLNINPCGQNSKCDILDKRESVSMSCRCPDGYTGDPFSNCIPTFIENQCKTDADCPLEFACTDSQCINPCSDKCLNSTCSVLNHRPVCHCQNGFAGNPEVGCVKYECSIDIDCSSRENCINNICKDPCTTDENKCGINASCIAENHQLKCYCPSGSTGDPNVSCSYIQCTSDQSCESHESCVSGKCVDICDHYHPCGDDAQCKAQSHNYECTCPSGFVGNPRFSCKLPKNIQTGCRNDFDCPEGFGCIFDSSVTRYHNKISSVYIRFDDATSGSECRDLCNEHRPCGANAICSVIKGHPKRLISCSCPPGYHGDGKLECRKVPSHGGCLKDSDCLFSEACVNTLCKDPCNCGTNAQCHIRNHRPYCSCPHGYIGDPIKHCHRGNCIDDVDCSSDKVCIENKCINPCSEKQVCSFTSECFVENRKPKCKCPIGTRGNPNSQCKSIDCTVNSDCPANFVCNNGLCNDICDKQSCGVNAECKVINKNAVCECPSGYKGNASIGCDARVSACISDHDCNKGLACSRGECTDPCAVNSCAPQTACTVVESLPVKSVLCSCKPGFSGNPQIQCRKIINETAIDCTKNSDCSRSFACLEGHCHDPCACGANAVCKVTNHHPVCSCAPEYMGDPYTSCIKSGCRLNSDCPLNTECYNGICTDSCLIKNPCGRNANCFVDDHKSKCQCDRGFDGDPYQTCSNIKCQTDRECPSEHKCLQEKCTSICTQIPCGLNAICQAKNHERNCTCPVGYEGDPQVRCDVSDKQREEVCENDVACRTDHVCIDGVCRNPCDAQPCGINADCIIRESFPFKTMICKCKLGYQGDASTQCRPLSGTEIAVGCSKDSECKEDLACINRRCSDPCNCGANALCNVVKHRSICTCANGYEGNPQVACLPSGCTDSSDCLNNFMCYNGKCVSPCLVDNSCAPTAECTVINHKAICQCPSGTEGDANVNCLVIGCRVHKDCPGDRFCLNGQCRDPCVYNNTCGIEASCRTLRNEVQCSCPGRETGDPLVSCPPIINQKCQFDSHCAEGLICLDNSCVEPCDRLKPCAESSRCSVVETLPVKNMVCACPDFMISSVNGGCVDIDTVVEVGCRSDPECPPDRACLNTRCVKPCDCGANAECDIIDHRPVCTCLEGYIGEPKTGCYKAGCSVNEECPTNNMCKERVCVNPCLVEDPCAITAECYPENHQAVCRCPPGFQGDPFVRCFEVGCKTNSDCPTDKSCVNGVCANPCLYANDCAPNAECYVFQHTVGCRCPTNMPYGDPRFKCEEKTVVGFSPPLCRVDRDCPSKLACINQTCIDPCQSLQPCHNTANCDVIDSIPVRTMVCICPEGYIMSNKDTCVLMDLKIPLECSRDSDCGQDMACVNNMCKDPCNCGTNADCDVVDHRAVCTCQVSYQGNPDTGCFPIGCQQDTDCEDDKACYSGVCANPCLVNDPCAANAECYATRHKAFCKCPSGLRGDGYTECILVGCRVNTDCPFDRGCINTQCIDPCAYEDPCSPSAECVNDDHEAKCKCPAGHAGDPKLLCSPIITPECTSDGDCPSQQACLNRKCENPCTALTPCHASSTCKVIDTTPLRTMLCICPDGMVVEEGGICELVPPIKPGCKADPECPSDKACINGFCKDPCQCGANANCKIVEHHPICTCKDGYEGNPEIGCYETGCYGTSDCPSTHACRNAKCVPVCGPNNEPCGEDAVCQGVNHEALCLCPPGSKGNPRTQCIAIGCLGNEDCPDKRSCINNLCIDPCTFEPCQPPATCRVEDHEPTCPCPPGFNGTLDRGCERIIIGCRVDSECPPQLACINGKCSNLCNLDPCGQNTDCRGVDTIPVRTASCECLPGYQGDAAVICTPTPSCPFEKGFLLDEEGKCRCPLERGFYVNADGNCVECPLSDGYILTEDGMCICDKDKGYIPLKSGVCGCPLPMTKNEEGKCILLTDPPPIPGCTSNSECSTDRACDRGACVFPCGYDPCAKYATCINVNHTAVCTCIAGYKGDPYAELGCVPTVYRTDFPRPDMVVNCLADGVQVDVNIGNSGFNGVLYVKGYSKNEDCRRVVKPDVDAGTIDFKVKFNTCGLVHDNGLAQFILVVQKHPKLVTYKAQANHVKCIYNTGEKTINIGFNVSMLTTAGTIQNTGPPPTCQMKITDQFGGHISSADIGDLLMLRVEIEPSDIYGGFARSCIALTSDEDGENEYMVTDENGCATDPAIFQEWDHDKDQKSLFALFNAFKFPSSNSIRFQCNVRVCFGKCQPVNCNGYDAFGKRRRRRQAIEEDAEFIGGAGQTVKEIFTDDTHVVREISVSSQAILTIERRPDKFQAEDPTKYLGPDEVCVSKWGFIIALVITALLALVAVAVAVSCWLMAYRRRPKYGGPLPHPTDFPNPLFTTPDPIAEPSPDYLS